MRITASPASGQTSSPPSKPSSAPGYGYRASQRPDLCGEMKSRFADGDFSGALVFAEKLLESEPEHADAVLYAGSCRTGLAEAFLEELGSRDKVPYLLGDSVTLVSLDLDPAHGFVVAQIDGMATIDEIMDVCGQAEHETLRLLYDLLKRDVIAVR